MNKKLKILQINKFHYLRGGSERYVFSVSEVLREKGHQVIPFSMASFLNEPSEYSKYFVDYIDLHKFRLNSVIKFFYNYDAVRKLKKIIKLEKPEVAHLHNIAHQLTPAIIKVLKKNNIKIVQTLHDYKLICPNTKLYNKKGNCQKCKGGKYYQCFLNSCMHNSRSKSFLGMLEAYLYQRIVKVYDLVDVFIAPSQFMKDINVVFGVPEEKIKVLYNFLTDDWLAPRGVTQTSETDIENNYLLYFGRLSEEKGVRTLLEAMNKIGDDLVLKIVGAGDYEQAIKDLRVELNLEKRVELVGFQTGEALDKYIENARAVIMPSLWPENMPYSLLESLAMGKIVIASRVGGMPELIKDGEDGYLYPAGDAEELAKKIQELQDLSPIEALNMQNRAKKQVAKLNKNSHYQELIKIYQS